MQHLPPLLATLIRKRFDAVEVDEICVSKARNLWLWGASSRYTGQILAFALGDRSLATLERLWAQMPDEHRYRLVYTDGYVVYREFFSTWQHPYHACMIVAAKKATETPAPPKGLTMHYGIVAKPWFAVPARTLGIHSGGNDACD